MKAALAGAGWLAASLPAWLRYQRALSEPEAAQRAVLQKLISRNRDCAFGRAHNFASLRGYDEFAARVPVSDYAAHEPWIARVMRGESAVLTSEPVVRLLPTSGTTGGRKLIPFTRTFSAELNAAIGAWIVDLNRRHPGALGGPMYWSISPAIPASEEPSAVPIGFDDDNAYVGTLRRWLVESAFAVPPALRLVRSASDSRHLTALCLLRQPSLRLISVWHPSFFALLLDAVSDSWDELLRDIERGGCARVSDVSFALAPEPQRARELRSMEPTKLREIWPYLRVVSCWTDAQSELPAAALQRRLPHVPIQAKGLLATEAVVTIPFGVRHPVAVTSHFYEFADDRGRIFRAHELARDEAYSVIVTTGAGLWRYPLGDLVEVDGFVGRTPSLRFLGRGGSVSDMCGEKLAEPFVTRAIGAACSECGVTPEFAMLAPDLPAEAAPRYTLFVSGTCMALADVLDRELRKNPHYALCRDLGQLGPLCIFAIEGNAARKYADALAAEGRRLGDIKPCGLSARTDWREVFQASESERL